MSIRFVVTKEIAQSTELETGEVRVPEWDKYVQEQSGDPETYAIVLIRELSAAERAKISALMVSTRARTVSADFRNLPKLQAMITVLGAITETGDHMFEQKDASWLADKSSVAVAKIAQAIQRLSGMMLEQDSTVDQLTKLALSYTEQNPELSEALNAAINLLVAESDPGEVHELKN